MKRMIINYTDFLGAIDSLFSSSSLMNLSKFKERVAREKDQRREKDERVLVKLNYLKAEIEKYKQKIREAIASNNKKEYGIHLNQLIKIKQELIKTYKEEKKKNSFTEQSKDTKVCACTKSLLQKYILEAFIRSSRESYTFNSDGTVSLNVEFFLHSDLYQQAQHIRDYINSYIERYPERVKGERYFVGLHKRVAGFEELITVVDEYFEKLNEANKQDNLLKSHEGIEVIATYPEYNVQAVRLLNKDALRYEGAQMHHCVGTYADKVEKGETQIYSIRDMGDDLAELKPHATIEFKEGKITQIKGPRDSIIDEAYLPATKKLLMLLAEKDNFYDIIQDKNISDSEKKNLCVYQDKDGNFYDIYDLPENVSCDDLILTNDIKIKDTRLKALPLNRIKFKHLEICGVITEKSLKYLSTAKGINKITFNAEIKIDADVLDLSAIKSPVIILKSPKEFLCKKIILSPQTTDLEINADSPLPLLREIMTSSTLKNLTMNGIFSQLERVPETTENITLAGTFDKLKYLSETVEMINLSGNYQELKHLPKGLKNLRLSGDFPALDCFSEGELEELKDLSLSGNITYLPETISFSQLKTLDIQAIAENLEYLDVSQCMNLRRLDIANSHFIKLKKLKIPSTVNNFSASHCVFNALESIDVEDMPYNKYGTIEVIGHIPLYFGDNIPPEVKAMNVSIPDLGGYCTNWSLLPSLKEIKLPENVEVIAMMGMHIPAYDFSTLAKYKNLKSLDLDYAKIGSSDIDLSQNPCLESLSIELPYIKQIKHPERIKYLKIRNIDKQSVVFPDLSQYIALEKLQCNFGVDPKDIPPLKELQIEYNERVELEILDFSEIGSLQMSISGKSDLPNLKKILLAEDFHSVNIYKTCPRLSEIDVSRTKGVVHILSRRDDVETRSGQTIAIDTEQMELLKKIRIGEQTEIDLPETLAISPLILEITAETSVEKEHKLRQQYPHLQIIREQQKRGLPLHLLQAVREK